MKTPYDSIQRLILPSIIAFFAIAVAAQDATPPLHVLANEHATVTVLLPHAEQGLYTDFRFDWSGIVADVDAGGHHYFGLKKTAEDGTTSYRPRAGTTDEFKVDLTLNELDKEDPESVGQKIRIGVGVVSSYWEQHNRKQRLKWRVTEAFPWTVETTDASITFRQDVKRGPWGYVLTKTVTLLPDEAGFTIRRQFKNTGEQVIACDHYCHNWLRIDGAYNAGQYRLRFPFEPVPEEGWRANDKTSLTEADDSWELAFGGRLWAALGPQKTVADNHVEVTNSESGGVMTMTGDWVPSAFNLYAQPGEVCPEPFIRIDLKTDEELIWTSTYRFSAKAPLEPPAEEK